MILHICWQDGVEMEGLPFYAFIQKCLDFFFQYLTVLGTKHLQYKWTLTKLG